MHDAVLAFRYVNLVAYATLGLVALRYWLRRRDPASMWAAATFGSLGLLVVLGLVPNHPGNLWNVFELSGSTITPFNTMSFFNATSANIP